MKNILFAFLLLSLNAFSQTIGPTSDGLFKTQSYGIFADGTDQSTEFNDMIAAIPAGATVRLDAGKTYTLSANVTINKALIIEGNDATLLWTGATGQSVLTITASNVKIEGINFKGTYGTYIANSWMLEVSGTSHTNRIKNVEISKCSFTDFRATAIRMQYVNNFRVHENFIDSVPYAGIAVYSCAEGKIEDNEISNITSLGTTGSNAYGITVNMLGSDSASRNIIISKNIIRNVTLWEGIDTHSGQALTLNNNELYNCAKSIAMVGGAAGVQKDINIQGNICDNDALGLGAECAITIEGLAGPTYATGISIMGNTLKGGQGGIKLQYAKGVSIVGNTIKKTIGGFGILCDAENLQVKIEANTFEDIMGTGNTAAVKTAGTTVNEIYIEGNSISDGGATVPASGNKNRYGFRANTTTQTNDLVRIGYNNFEAATIAPYGNTNFVRFLHPTGMGIAQVTTSATYVVLPADRIIYYEYSAGGTSITLPTNNALNNGRELTIVNSSTGAVTIGTVWKGATSSTTVAAGQTASLRYDFGASKIWRE